MIYYTADLHLGHENIIKHCSRPFSDVREMDMTIINNWNSVVYDKDDVYIVGDIAFRGEKGDTISKIKRLKGRKHLIIGNHDGHMIKEAAFTELFVSIEQMGDISDNGRRVILFHYPILEWNGFFRGSYHVYGHIHNGSPDAAAVMKTLPRAFNAGADLNDFLPQTLDMLINRKSMGLY